MKKYDSYKDSGVEWIGEIPSHWKCSKYKYYFESGMGETILREDLTENGEIPVFSATESDKIFGYVDEAKLILQKNDLVIPARGNSIGHLMLVEAKATCTQTTIYFKNKSLINSKFAFYFAKGNKDMLFQFDNTAIPQITVNQVKNNVVLIPSSEEQTIIANYLDHKTSQIDDLIAKKECLIQLLEEERTAIINQAVTKGLDPTVPMKDSGIEWLGVIPKHWEVKKLKYIKSTEKNAFVDGPFGSNLKTEHFIENGDVYVIDSGYITSGEFKIKRGFKTISLEHFETVKRSECKARDIIIAKIGANFGMSGILPELDKPSLVSGNTLKLTIDENCYDLEFIHLQLLNLKTSGEIDLLVKGSAQPALSMGVMSELPFVIPKTIDEQILVREYIKKNHERIDKLISKVSNEIELLKEYKTALISEVVTGKVDVRDYSKN